MQCKKNKIAAIAILLMFLVINTQGGDCIVKAPCEVSAMPVTLNTTQLCMNVIPESIGLCAISTSENEAPSKPIALTIIGPSLIAIGSASTIFGLIAIGNINQDFGSAIALLGGAFCLGGAAYIIPGVIVTVRATKRWDNYKAYKARSTGSDAKEYGITLVIDL